VSYPSLCQKSSCRRVQKGPFELHFKHESGSQMSSFHYYQSREYSQAHRHGRFFACVKYRLYFTATSWSNSEGLSVILC